MPLIRTYVRLIAPLVVRLAHGFVVHSKHDEKLLQSQYDLGQRPVIVAPVGPLLQYQPTVEKRGQRTIPESCCNLLFFGLIRPYKGLEDLIRAFDALPESEIANYWLTIVGETWEGWSVPADLISQSRYRDRITFVNRYVSDAEVTQFFAEADALVLPYHRVSASGPLHIAMSWGLPIVVTRVGGLIEAVEDYEGAILIAPEDSIALQNGLLQVAELRGKQYTNPHSWEYAAECYHKLFDTICPSDNRIEHGSTKESDSLELREPSVL